MWGEWIEMEKHSRKLKRKLGLSPCGESGLKYADGRRPPAEVLSLPVWGEWIEITRFPGLVFPAALSLPVWGEWIEIQSCVSTTGKPLRVSPRVGRVD